MIIKLCYNDFFRARRRFLFRDLISPVVYYTKAIRQDPEDPEETISEYTLSMNDGNHTLITAVTQDNLINFETTKKTFCQEVNEPATIELISHDFSNTSDWVHGNNNSFFVFNPIPGSTIKLVRGMVICETTTEITPQNPVRFCMWESMGSIPVPEYVVGERTVFGAEDVLFNPGATPPVYTGWYRVKPDMVNPIPEDMKNEFEVWYYFVNGDVQNPQWKVTSFTYDSLRKVRAKASSKGTFGTELQLAFEYGGYNIQVFYRHSMNERIEMYIEGDQPITSAGLPVTVSLMFYSYDEW
jgi:hypothetical protein